MIGFDYSGQFQNNITIQKRPTLDSIEIKDQFNRRGVKHDIRLIATPKAGYITISPSFSYSEIWYDHQLERYYDPADSIVKARDRNKFQAIRTFSTSVAVSTNLYGTIQPNVFGILGVRHKMTPSISYTFRPDFSEESFGYYKSYRDTTNREVRYDPFVGYDIYPGEIFGGVSAGESQSIGFNLGNTFEMKLKPNEDDTTQTPRKVQLLNLSASTSYNMVADSFRLSPISLSYHTTIGELISFDGGTSFSPYVFENGLQKDRYMINDGKGLARLTSFRFGLSTNLSNEMFTTSSKTKDTTAQEQQTSTQISKPYNFTLPWRLSITYNFSQDQFNPNVKTVASNLYASLSFTLGDIWKISASSYYDFKTGEIGAPQINVSRDLHCWELNFSWTPTGYYTRYMFVIRLKASQLQDIKLQKQGSSQGVF